MQASRTLIVANRMEEIRTIEAALEEFGEQHEFPMDALLQIQLALEELFTNVVSYAHDDDLEHEVEIRLSREGETITVEITDDGSPFDPLQDAPELDVESSLEERSVGGAGIRLAKQLMTELRYQRNSERNHLTLVKKI